MADWHVCAFSNAMKNCTEGFVFRIMMMYILCIHVYSTIFLVHPSPLYSQKIALYSSLRHDFPSRPHHSLSRLLTDSECWDTNELDALRVLHLLCDVPFPFTPCGELPNRRLGMRSWGLVLKARNWSCFFWKLDRKIQFVGWRGVFFPGAKRDF